MLPFQKKEIPTPKRVCLCLKEAREQKGVSLEEMSVKTRMSVSQLRALEECRFQDLPFAAVYQRHLIKAYTETLGLDPAQYIAQFSTEETPPSIFPPMAPRKPSFSRFMSLPVILRYGAALLVSAVCMTYLGFQVKGILEPPSLAIYSPQHGSVVNSPSLRVHGKTDPEVTVQINGTSIMQSDDGNFSANMDLATGVNTIVITAQKKHGKTTTETRHVVVREQKQISLTETLPQNTL